MKIRIFLLIFFIYSASNANAIVLSEQNGNHWNQLSATSKTYYASGFINGAHKAINEAISEVQIEIEYVPEYLKEKREKTLEADMGVWGNDQLGSGAQVNLKEQEGILLEPMPQLSKKINESITKSLWLGSTPVGQYLDGIDSLYADFKNRNILINDAFYIVKKQINGSSQKEIDAILIYLRGGKTDIKKLYFKDEFGDLQYLGFP